MLSPAIPPGDDEIQLFGDASYQYLITTGSWAFSAPALGLEGAGTGNGPSIEHFEIMAVVQGITTIINLDRTRRPIRVHTDSELAIRLLQCAVKDEPLPSRKSFDRLRALYERARALTGHRHLLAGKVSSLRPEHQECHRRAAKRLRDELAADAVLAWRLALRKEETRLEAVLKEKTTFQARLGALDEEELLLGIRIRALTQTRPPFN